MSISVVDIDAWLGTPENEHVEFKEAKSSFSFDELVRYCAALANEGGGFMVLGVSPKLPRHVVGSNAFRDLPHKVHQLLQRLHIRINAEEIAHPDGRVVVFTVPSRPLGVPIEVGGTFWMRAGESLTGMTPDMLRRIFDEGIPDFSAQPCPTATIGDLDGQAIADFRRRWIEKSRNERLASLSDDQLLRDAGLLVDGGVTYAALVLFGKWASLNRLLSQAEVVFEYRSSEEAGPAQQRKEYRQGFFSFYDDLWATLDLRNDTQHYQEGLFVRDIPTFDERSVREAVLNAVSHRDYQDAGSVFVRQYQRRLVVDSPGGFPAGITVDNMLDRQKPRNRLIAEAFARCGLVERSGQGMNLMFENSIRQGKARPDLTGSDDHFVVLTLHGEVTDPRFVQFVEKVGQETQASFDTHDFLVLDVVHRNEPVPKNLKSRVQRLVEIGVLEKAGRTRGTRYLLSKRFYSAIGERGAYTRRRGLDREENKALIVRHLKDRGSTGAPISEIQLVLPSRSRNQLRRLLSDLREEGKIRLEGEKRGARWVMDNGK